MFSQITRRLNCSSAQQGCIIVMVSRQEVSTAPPRLPLSSHPITIKPSSTNIIQALNLFWNGIDHAVRYWITKLNYPSTRPAPLYGKPGAASCGSSTRSLYRGVSDLPACRSAALPPSVARPHQAAAGGRNSFTTAARPAWNRARPHWIIISPAIFVVLC